MNKKCNAFCYSITVMCFFTLIELMLYPHCFY